MKNRKKNLTKPQKSEKKSILGWALFGGRPLEWFRDGFGRVLGEFWEDLGRFLERFWESFGKIFEAFWMDLGGRTLISATKGKSMDGCMDGWMDGCID